MKYTIEGLNQERLCELGLDAVDAVLLRWFIDFWPNMEKKKVLGEEYGWVAYSHVIDELPIMYIENTEAIGRRFKKYRTVMLMDTFVDRGENSKTYFRLNSDIWRTLIADSRRLKSRQPNDSKVSGPATQKSDDSSSIDSSTNDKEGRPPLSGSAPLARDEHRDSVFHTRQPGEEEEVARIAERVPWRGRSKGET